MLGNYATREKSTRKGDFFKTYTGRRFYTYDPRPEDFIIEDMAHALSNICRFNGNIKKFFSIAEHLIVCSYLCEKEFALETLMHDSQETYICDMVRPVKHHPRMKAFRALEKKLEKMIAVNFGMQFPHPPAVKLADQICLELEVDQLHSRENDEDWDKWRLIKSPNLPKIKLRCWGPGEAEKMFLKRFKELDKLRQGGTPKKFDNYYSRKLGSFSPVKLNTETAILVNKAKSLED